MSRGRTALAELLVRSLSEEGGEEGEKEKRRGEEGREGKKPDPKYFGCRTVPVDVIDLLCFKRRWRPIGRYTD